MRADPSTGCAYLQFRFLIQLPAVKTLGPDPAVVKTLHELFTVPATRRAQGYIEHTLLQCQC